MKKDLHIFRLAGILGISADLSLSCSGALPLDVFLLHSGSINIPGRCPCLIPMNWLQVLNTSIFPKRNGNGYLEGASH